MSAESKPEASSSGSSSGGGKLVMILTLVNLVATLGMVAILFISFQKDRKKPTVEDISTENHAAADAHGEKAADGHGAKSDGHGGGHGGASKTAKKGAESGKMLALE